MAVQTYNLGTVTAYADAKAGGYTGTKEEWQALMASYATVAESAAASATTATNAKNDAVSAKTAAEAARDRAETAALTLTIDDTLTQSGQAADAKKTGNELSSVKKDLSAYGIIDYNKHLIKTTRTDEGVTYTYDSTNDKYTFVGTSGTTSVCNLILQNPLTDIKAGVPIHIKFNSTDTNVWLQIYRYVGSTLSFFKQEVTDEWITLPSDTTGVLVRARASNNKTVDGYFTIDIKGFYTREEISNVITALDTVEDELSNKLGYVKVLTSDDDMDDYGDTGAYCYLNSNKPTHAPEDQNNGVVVVIHGYNDTGFTSQIVTTNGNKFYFRNRFSSGYWTPWKELTSFESELSEKLGYVKVLTSEDDMDDYGNTGAYCYLNSNKPANAPSDENNGVVTVIHGYNDTGFATQIVTTNGNKFYFRNRFTSGYWTPWKELTSNGGETGDTIIENTYNITTSPTITTDTNGWLQSVDTDTSDETGKTDMTGAIMSMLTDTGYCHLGEGIFYVSGNIDMPDGSMLCGCGKKTVVRLLQSTTTGYCVKIGKFCTIKDISFEGARSFSMPSSKGTRNGIAFMAEYDASPSVTTSHCMISNVWCKYFSGAGIYCHNTSINYAKGVYVSNAFIDTCYVGIDIDYYSEFNKFVNVCTAWCKYGCINNGGNNVFSNCTFHATDTGFFIDGTQPNNAHGTITGCTFCHIGSNAGKAIHIKDSANGFVINACQIWYNSINIENSSGIVISNCELGRGTNGAGATIVITGGDTVMVVGCVFMNDQNYAPDITITNNTKVKFVNCYGSVSGNAITA